MPQTCRRPSPSPRGATLIELVVALAVLTVLCVLAFPSLSGSISRIRADMLRMQLVSVFQSARSAAITRAEPIAVCPSDDGQNCGSDWSRGWLIHRDRSGHAGSPTAEDILQFRTGYHDSSIHAWTTQGRQRLRFQGDGRSGGSPLTVNICAGGQLTGRVIVNNVGRTRAARVPDAPACFH